MDEQIREQIKYVCNNIPYYKELHFSKSDNISQFPVMTKEFIRNNYEVFLSDQLGDVKQKLIKYLVNTDIETQRADNELYFDNNIIIEETTGTSGVPFRCFKTKNERKTLSIEIWKQRWWIDKNVTPTNLLQFSHIQLNRNKPDIYNIDVDNLISIYNNIIQNKIRWIHSTPVILMRHIEVLKRNNIVFDFNDIKYIESCGYHLNEEVRKTIQSFFGADIINQYGSIETWPMALSCNAGHLHINDKIIFFELLTDKGEVITEENKIGEVVVTTLINKMFPLIRYRTGDYAYYENKNCVHPLGNTCIVLVEGRECNLIWGLNKRVMGNHVFKKIIRSIHFRLNIYDLKYIQIIQEEEKKFHVYMNKVERFNEIKGLFERLTCQELERKIVFCYTFLSKEGLDKKMNEKPNLFVSRMSCKEAEK